jgi:uncharacterized protein YqeY
MSLRDKISEDLIAAMKAREGIRLSVLRMMKAAVKNKEIDARTELDDGRVIQVLSTLIKQRKDSIEQFVRGNRNDLAEKEAAEIKIIQEYLPAAIPEEEIAALVDLVVRETGASTPKDVGRVMKECMSRLAGKQVDGKKVSLMVKDRLEKAAG